MFTFFNPSPSQMYNPGKEFNIISFDDFGSPEAPREEPIKEKSGFLDKIFNNEIFDISIGKKEREIIHTQSSDGKGKLIVRGAVALIGIMFIWLALQKLGANVPQINIAQSNAE